MSLVTNKILAQENDDDKDIYQLCKEWFDLRKTKEIKTMSERLSSLELKIEQAEPDTPKVNLLLRASIMFWWQNNSNRQLELATEARKLSKKLAYHDGLARAIWEERKAYSGLKNRELALKKDQSLMLLCDSVGTPLCKVYKYRSIAEQFDGELQFDSSLVYYKKALKIAEKLGIEHLISNLNSLIYWVYYCTDKSELEEEHLIITIKSLLRQNDLINIMSTLNDLGDHYGMIPLLGHSVQAFLLAIEMCEALEFTEHKAGIYSNLANNYVLLNENEKALRNFRMAAEVNLKTENKNWLGINYRGFSKVYLKTKKYKEALKYARKAAELSKNELYDTLFVGEALLKLGRYQEAYNCFNVASHKTVVADARMEKSWAQGIMGELFFELYTTGISINDNLGAEIPKSEYLQLSQKHLEEALANDEKLEGYIEAKSKRQKLISQVYFAKGEYKKGYLALARYQELNDSIFSIEKDREITSMVFKQKMEQDSLKNLQERIASDASHQLEISNKDKQRTVSIISGLAILLLALVLYSRLRSTNKSKKLIEIEKQRSEDLLLNILPAEVADELKAEGEYKAKNYEAVSVLFTDLEGFTKVASKMTAEMLVQEIGGLFKAFDNICDKYGIEKIKTIGDAYMAASGLHQSEQDEKKYTANLVRASLEMQEFVAQKRMQGKSSFQMRLGIHTGPVVAGIVGVKKFQYDIWGDTVNTASRMESHGEVGKVNISEATYQILRHSGHDPESVEFTFEAREELEIKGKGLMKTYFVNLME
ncbi:MAG: tetratricopeptide repeat protein [Bacteroidia bacterium]